MEPKDALVLCSFHKTNAKWRAWQDISVLDTCTCSTVEVAQLFYKVTSMKISSCPSILKLLKTYNKRITLIHRSALQQAVESSFGSDEDVSRLWPYAQKAVMLGRP